MNDKRGLTHQITSTEEGMLLWQQERAIFEITERICELMEEKGISRADLAKRLGTSRGYVTQLLDGTANMTLRKVSDLYLAVGRQFHPDDGPINLEGDVAPVTLRVCNYRQTTTKPPEARVHATFETIKASQVSA